MKPELLAVSALPSFLAQDLERDFILHTLIGGPADPAFEEVAPKIRGIAATAWVPVTAGLIGRLPRLEIISTYSVGYDSIDVETARARGIVVTNTPDVLTADVADFAMTLLLAASRGVVQADRFVREKCWEAGAFPLMHRVSGARLGIVGLGRIGRAVAHRAEAFGMSIAYTNPKPKSDVPYSFFPDVEALAAHVDFLVVSAPGGAATQSLIDEKVLRALGPDGTLVNIARGSLIDEPALIEALRSKTIRAAALDVFAHEPRVPAELMALENVVAGSACRQRNLVDSPSDGEAGLR